MGTHSALGERSHTAAHTAKQGPSLPRPQCGFVPPAKYLIFRHAFIYIHFPVLCEPSTPAEEKNPAKLPPQRCFKPLLISIFNFSHKRPTLAFVGESGYTLGFANKIAHKGTHAETGAFRTGPLSLPSERSARSQTSPGRVSERQTLPLWGLAGGTPEERREPSGQRCAYARRCSEASRPRWAAQLYLFIGVFTFVKDLAGCCQYSSPITKGAADSNIRIGTLSGHDQNTPRRSKIQKLNAMRQHIRVLQCMALRLSG